MDNGTKAAIIAALAAVVSSGLLWLSTRRGQDNVEDADLRRWSTDLLSKVQEATREVDRLRTEAHALADELRAIRTHAWEEDSMPRFRSWLADRPNYPLTDRR